VNVDLIYTAWNRREFTEKTFEMLLEHTDWDLVRTLHVFDDGSTDGAREFLYERIHDCPVEYHMHELGGKGPVGAMNYYVAELGDSDYFAKIDSDIAVPPGWLNALLETAIANPVDVLGCEAGRMGIPADDFDGVYTVEHARWIGGVGLLRTAALRERPQMIPRGRFGWTEFQMEHRELRIGWITPDLAISELQRVPVEPWASLSARYLEFEWQREWPAYHERWTRFYWGWWQ
jgi:glycosyltransferase involved in cell wall biosynthesis